MGCLFCQNWHYRLGPSEGGVTPHQLASAVDEKTACICYFGGDPSSQAVHAIRASEISLEQSQGRILRICIETNGRWDPRLLSRAARLSFQSGGCIKFDLKAWTPEVHYALTGFGPDLTRKNFASLMPMYRNRPEPPFLIGCTLLVPGYVDEQEVGSIARWLASLDATIPYNLLVFHPQFLTEDLPVTSRRQTTACLEAAKDAGLERVHVGNLHLLRG
jgi:pyruvate formate lyase activating enzyme